MVQIPRAEFNIVATVRGGTGAPFPGAFKRFIAGRLVPDQREVIQNLPYQAREWYFTYVAPTLLAASALVLPPTVTLDFSVADVLDFPTLGLTDLQVLFTERVTPRFGAAVYFRTHLQQS